MISIIIPVYNAAKYLDECIQSVITQSYVDYELLLINDGSTDGSAEICEGYAGKYSRIRVYHQKNLGVSAARNLGLQHALGEWITFIDSDDWIADNYLQELDEQYDWVLYNIACMKGQVCRKRVEFDDIDCNRAEFMTRFRLFPNFPGPYAKFYKRAIILKHSIQFNEHLHFGEDALFNITYLRYVDKIKSFAKDYYYRDTEGGLSKTELNYHHDLLFFTEVKSVLLGYNDANNVYRNLALPLKRLLNSIYTDTSTSVRQKRQRLAQLMDSDSEKLIRMYRDSSIRTLVALSCKLKCAYVLNAYFCLSEWRKRSQSI